jgi:hypothetical protein
MSRFLRCNFLLYLFFLPALTFAQAPPLNLTGSTNCTAADFDLNLRFESGPADTYSVIILQRNLSAHPCIFDGPQYPPTVIFEAEPSTHRMEMCNSCTAHFPPPTFPSNPLLLAPGEVARHTLSWQTTAVRPLACVQPEWMDTSVRIVSRTLLKKICSVIEVSAFTREVSPSSDNRGFTISSSKPTYYSGESFSVHVTPLASSARDSGPIRLGSDSPRGSGPVISDDCPVFYIRVRSPDGYTRYDESKPLAFKPCGPATLGHSFGDWRSGFDLDSGVNSRWGGLGQNNLQVSQLTGNLVFVTSNVLPIEIADPSAIVRKWGPRDKGIAADITLDKDTFLVGEDVQLHLAVENFDAPDPIYGANPTWDPCDVFQLEVQDASGHALLPAQLFQQRSICMGHGFGPMLYGKGVVVPMERSLGSLGQLPNSPGAYTIVLSWSAATSHSAKEINQFAPASEFHPYAVARATASIRILPSP